MNATVNGWWALFRDPDQLAALRGDRSLIPAVEELMRYDTPLQLLERWVLEDIEIDSTTVPGGDGLASSPTTTRRSSRPGESISRLDNPHISFSAGIRFHRRPAGPPRTGGVLGALLEKAPTLALAAEPERKPNFVIRGLGAKRRALTRRPRARSPSRWSRSPARRACTAP